MSEDRFELLETKILYQEDIIKKLDDALIDQQKQILDLQIKIKNMISQIQTMEDQVPSGDSQELPPHY